jgi:hypothetical protein
MKALHQKKTGFTMSKSNGHPPTPPSKGDFLIALSGKDMKQDKVTNYT